ncbi:MAG: VPDSG-CTERM sorting domain-containing protein [Verrucomicrobiae bacterium]|nr:VPDSG-CTERM sorting domain-containing protein [Verrucomicrobiae bacterium]
MKTTLGLMLLSAAVGSAWIDRCSAATLSTEPLTGQPILGTNGLVNLWEAPVPAKGAAITGYWVDIVGDAPSVVVAQFAVSNREPVEPRPFTIDGWEAEEMSLAEWNIDPRFKGTAEQFFDDDDTFVSLFTVGIDTELAATRALTVGGEPLTGANDEDFGDGISHLFAPVSFAYTGAPATQFVAFDANGGVVSQSKPIQRNGSVPDGGSTGAMLGTVVLGLGLGKRLRRRR